MSIDLSDPKPLYQQLADDLKEKISEGKLKPGDPIYSQNELVKKYNVSLITVKKALSDLKQGGYLYTRVGLGTFVAAQTPSVDFKKNQTIGFVLRDLESPFFSRILSSVEKTVSELGINLLLSSTAQKDKNEDNMVQHFLDIGVSGIVIASMSHKYHASSVIKKMHTSNFPYVVVSYLQDVEYNHIGSDHEEGGFLATEHLIRLGYKKIAYINSEFGNILGSIREKGYRRALNKYHIEASNNLIYQLMVSGEISYFNYGYEIGQKMIESKKIPEAVFAYNDLIAIGFERAVLDAGMSIPCDIAIIGFDNIKRGTVAQVPISTVNQPTDEIGKKAIEFLIKKMQNFPVENRIIFKPEIIIRESCGARHKILADV